MKIIEKTPARKFVVGLDDQIVIKDCGSIKLNNNEQVTFITSSDKEYDVVRKDWGFYATPSLNGRLKRFGFKTALVKNSFNKYYVMIVDPNHMDSFKSYLKEEKQIVMEWLDEK